MGPGTGFGTFYNGLRPSPKRRPASAIVWCSPRVRVKQWGLSSEGEAVRVKQWGWSSEGEAVRVMQWGLSSEGEAVRVKQWGLSSEGEAVRVKQWGWISEGEAVRVMQWGWSSEGEAVRVKQWGLSFSDSYCLTTRCVINFVNNIITLLETNKGMKETYHKVAVLRNYVAHGPS